LSLDSSGQIHNSWSSDSTGIYFNSIDSLIRIIKANNRLDRVFISKRDLTQYHEEIPDAIAGIPILTTEKKAKKVGLRERDFYIGDFDLQLIEEKLSVMMTVFHLRNGEVTTYKQGMWAFHYILDNNSKSWNLDSVHEVSINVHFYK